MDDTIVLHYFYVRYGIKLLFFWEIGSWNSMECVYVCLLSEYVLHISFSFFLYSSSLDGDQCSKSYSIMWQSLKCFISISIFMCWTLVAGVDRLSVIRRIGSDSLDLCTRVPVHAGVLCGLMFTDRWINNIWRIFQMYVDINQSGIPCVYVHVWWKNMYSILIFGAHIHTHTHECWNTSKESALKKIWLP